MVNNSANVSVGKPSAAGGIFSAVSGTAAPINATAALAAAYKGLGYVSEEGLTNSVEMETLDIKAWGGDTAQTIRVSRDETFSWTFIETSEDVLKEVYGADNVTVDGTSIAVVHNNKELPSRVYVFEILLTGNRVKRIVVPNGKVSEIGDVVYQDGEPIGYTVTLKALADVEGNTVYEYIATIVPYGD